MKSIQAKLMLVCLGSLLLQGCVAFPPLIQVKHDHAAAPTGNEEVLRRLDAIDRRLNALENQSETH